MKTLLIYLLESSICLGIGLIFYKLVLERLTHFEGNRYTLLSFLILALGLPLLSFELAVTTESVMRTLTLPAVTVGDPSTVVGPEATPAPSILPIVLGGMYASVSLYFLFRLIMGLLRLYRMIRQGQEQNYMGFRVLIHPDFPPASFFRYIFLPSFDPESTSDRQIFLHESMHVRRSHSIDLLILQLIKIVFWFNPLIYLYEKYIREVHEYEADGAVSEAFSKTTYSHLLVDQLTRDTELALAHAFNQFQTKKRILMMNQNKSTGKDKLRFLLVLPLLGLLFFVFSCEITPEAELEGPTQMGEKQASLSPSSALNGRIAVGTNGEEIFDVVETQPNPPGGMEGWNNYLRANLTYPSEAKQVGAEGTVIVVFVVQADGSITDVEILRGVGAGCDEEAIRVVENSPNWEPGMQKGRTVNTRMRLPIRFKLTDQETQKTLPDGLEEVIEAAKKN
ncbi:TonB family protein [Algoriphagus namhaensis]